MLVLTPIERMMKKVKDLAENPLSRQDFGEGNESGEQFETKILENAFTKICSLMAVGFGEVRASVAPLLLPLSPSLAVCCSRTPPRG